MFELHHLSAVEQLDQLRRGELTPGELVEHALARIAELDAPAETPGGERPPLGAFATLTPDAARARAAALAADPTLGGEVPAGRAAPLWGLPIGDKDLHPRAGVRTMFGSRAFAGFVPDASDELVRTVDAAAAVSLGKTNTPEFGMPCYTSSAVAPTARTPYDLGRHAGGSSGGAAVAVAAGLLPVAPGSDGGGSIRIPAAACGLVGLKPSRGRVAAGSGLDSPGGLPVVGALARSVADAALLLDALAPDSTAAAWPHAVRAPRWDGGAFLNAAVRGEGRFQLGVSSWSPWATSHDIRPEPAAIEAVELAARLLDELGHGLEPVEPAPEPDYDRHFRAAWFGGVSILPLSPAQEELVEPRTRWLIEQSRRMRTADFAAALAWFAGFERRVIAAFAPFDAVLVPAMAQTPRPLDWYDESDGARNFDQQVEYTPYTSFANVTGLPAIALPVHVTAEGLPMGVQLIGRPGREDVLLALGAQLERRLGWQHRHPPQW